MNTNEQIRLEEKKMHDENLKLVSENGAALRFVKDQTKDICIAAITNDPTALQYIKPELLDRDLMKAAILLTGELGTDTDYIIDVKKKGRDGWTFCICEEGNAQISTARRNAAQTFSGSELYELYAPLIKADKSGAVMEDLLRAGIITDDLIKLMGKEQPITLLRLMAGYGLDDFNPYVCSFHPEMLSIGTRMKIVTQKLCDDAFEAATGQEELVIRLIPDRCKTERICKKALKINPALYTCFPQTVITKEMWETILNKDPSVIAHIRNPSVELRMCALKRDPEQIANMPQSEELCIFAVNENPKVFQLCNKQTPKLVLVAIKKDCRNIRWLQPSIINQIDDVQIHFKNQTAAGE